MTSGLFDSNTDDRVKELLNALDKDIYHKTRTYKSEYCWLCDFQHGDPSLYVDHLQERHKRQHLLLTVASVKGELNPVSNVRYGTSNRSLIQQMEKWGWVQGPRKSDQIVMRLGDKEMKVNAPDVHRNNLPAKFVLIYDLTGVSPDGFWSLGEKKDAPTPAPALPKWEDDVVKTRGQSTLLLGILLRQDKRMEASELEQMTGLTHRQVMTAMNYNVKHQWADRIKQGVWEATRKAKTEHSHRVLVDIERKETAVVNAAAETPVVAPEIPVVAPERPPEPPAVVVPVAPAERRTEAYGEVTEEEIFALLDMLVPQRFAGKHFRAVERWVTATQELVSLLRADR